MPADEYEVLKSYAFFVGSSINDVLLRAVRTYLRARAADAQLDAMVEEARRRFQETVERMPDE